LEGFQGFGVSEVLADLHGYIEAIDGQLHHSTHHWLIKQEFAGVLAFHVFSLPRQAFDINGGDQWKDTNER